MNNYKVPATADVVVIGGGIYGASIAYNLVNLGAKNVVLLERNEYCSGGTAKSCAVVRTHYSIPANMLHAVESLKIFEDFEEVIGGTANWLQTGYIVLGPQEYREPMENVFRSQNQLGIDTAVLDHKEAHLIHPLLNFDDVDVIGYDTQAGYCDPHLTTSSYLSRASELGALTLANTPVSSMANSRGITRIETPNGTVETPNVVLAVGPWTNSVASHLNIKFPYEVSQHKVITLKSNNAYKSDWPVVKDLTTEDKIYFRHTTPDGLLVGTGDHGYTIRSLEDAGDAVDPSHINRIVRLMANRMPSFKNAEFVTGWTGPYDITPDWNPIVGPVPNTEGLYVAVGFSGHGFKLAPTIGESLAQSVLGLQPRVPIEAYSFNRFSEGKHLQGAYGVGSIA